MSPPPPQRQRSDAIISPPWLGCSSLVRWKSIIDFIVQRIAMVGLICEQGGGDNDTDTVIGGGGLLGGYYYILMATSTLGEFSIIVKASDSV